MPKWAGRWKGGRYYVDGETGKRVYFLERRAEGRQQSIKLRVHDEDLAMGELARFLSDPGAYMRERRAAQPPPEPPPTASKEAVFITSARIRGYLLSISDTVRDHRQARRSYLNAWSQLGLDLRAIDRKTYLKALKNFDGGHRGRTEALNAFGRWLVSEEELERWPSNLLPTPDLEPKPTRAKRQVYSIDQLEHAFRSLKNPALRDLFWLLASTGMHQTEVSQLVGAPVIKGPLPDDESAAIRELGDKQRIRGVIQVMHKSGTRHRISVDQTGLEAAMRLTRGVPHRLSLYKELPADMVAANLRHTFVTLAGEVGELVTYSGKGVDRARVAAAVGHRAGSTMTADRYEKVQVPPMIALPLNWDLVE